MRKISKESKPAIVGGLCISCRKADECTFPRNPLKPVLQCEEFEAFPCKPGGTEYSPAGRQGRSETLVANAAKHLGLCANCKHLETCTFPRPEGGVWRCDEYE